MYSCPRPVSGVAFAGRLDPDNSWFKGPSARPRVRARHQLAPALPRRRGHRRVRGEPRRAPGMARLSIDGTLPLRPGGSRGGTGTAQTLSALRGWTLRAERPGHQHRSRSSARWSPRCPRRSASLRPARCSSPDRWLPPGGAPRRSVSVSRASVCCFPTTPFAIPRARSGSASRGGGCSLADFQLAGEGTDLVGDRQRRPPR